jgi:ribosomal protein S18 acetylase RimI-like enzyme
MNFSLREFQPADSAAVNALALEAFQQYRDNYRDWDTFSRNLANTAALADSGELIVAESDGQLAGAVVYVGPNLPKRDFFAPEWPILRMLVVSPRLRGHGVGRALTDECIRRARRDQAPLIALHTSPIMSVALPMYLRLGFTFVKEVSDIFGVPYGVYAKPLQP